MKQDYAKKDIRNFREGGIDKRYSQRYNVGVPYIKRNENKLITSLVLAGCLGLAALAGTCDRDAEKEVQGIKRASNYEVPVYRE